MGGIQRWRRRQPLSILAYHRLLAAGEENPFADNVVEGDPQRFRAQLRMLTQGRDVIGLADLRAGLDAPGSLPPSPLMITFDDGYRSCVDVALPILEELGLRATFFIATEFIERRRMYWWDVVHFILKKSTRDRLRVTTTLRAEIDRRDPGSVLRFVELLETASDLDFEAVLQELARSAGVVWNRERERQGAEELLMGWEDVRRLHAAGMDLAAHTRTHRVLQTLSAEELRSELRGCREDLQRRAGVDTDALAYPSGYAVASDPRIRAAILEAGFALGFSFGGGRNDPGQVDRFDLRRVSMDPALSDTMHRMQLILPQLGYRSARATGFSRGSEEGAPR